jgi:CRP-like cAMP-binding protein
LGFVKPKTGDYFGETALLTNANRGATITASGDCTCLTLGRKQFTSLFGEDRLNITFAKRAAISAEGGFNPDKKQDNDIKELPPAGDRTKTSEQRRKILTVVENNILFQNLDREQQGQVVDTMWTKEIKKGTTIIKQGTLGDVFYVVEAGSFDIFVSREGKEPIRVATRGPYVTSPDLHFPIIPVMF